MIERCPGSTCSGTDFQFVATSPTTSYSNTGLTPSTTYRYRVQARDAANNLSGYSPIASATTSGDLDTQPPTVPGTPAVSAGPNQLQLTWTASTDNSQFVEYVIERCAATCSAGYVQVAISATNAYVDTSVAPGADYSYRLLARDAVPNYSAYSGSSSTATPAYCD